MHSPGGVSSAARGFQKISGSGLECVTWSPPMTAENVTAHAGGLQIVQHAGAVCGGSNGHFAVPGAQRVQQLEQPRPQRHAVLQPCFHLAPYLCGHVVVGEPGRRSVPKMHGGRFRSCAPAAERHPPASSSRRICPPRRATPRLPDARCRTSGRPCRTGRRGSAVPLLSQPLFIPVRPGRCRTAFHYTRSGAKSKPPAAGRWSGNMP